MENDDGGEGFSKNKNVRRRGRKKKSNPNESFTGDTC